MSPRLILGDTEFETKDIFSQSSKDCMGFVESIGDFVEDIPTVAARKEFSKR
jgi:hypothetical protein